MSGLFGGVRLLAFLAAAGLASIALAACAPTTTVRPSPAAVTKAEDASVILADDFGAASGWRAAASESASAKLAPSPGGRGLELAYGFPRAAGYAFIRRMVDLDLGGNFALDLRFRVAAPRMGLEIKFTDSSGENVWWRQYRSREFTGDWENITIRRNDVSFAWGSTADRRLGRIAAIEIVLVGASGQSGTAVFDRIDLRRLPEPPAVAPAIAVAEASGPGAEAAVDGNKASLWRVVAGPDDSAELTLDLGFSRDFGGFALDWAEAQAPVRTEAAFSDDQSHWTPFAQQFQTRGADGPVTYLRAREVASRYVRLRFHAPAGTVLGLREARLEPREFGDSDNGFLAALGAQARRGAMARAFTGEQVYWTLVGAPEGGDGGLFSEDGAFEPGPGAFSVEPFVLDEAGGVGAGGVGAGGVGDWANAAENHWLPEAYLPLPVMRRDGTDYSLEIRAHRAAEPGAPSQRSALLYRLTNRGAVEKTFHLALAVRPFQVNSPAQFLNLAGGAAAIRRLEWDGRGLRVNEDWRLDPASTPEAVAAASFLGDAFPLAAAPRSSPAQPFTVAAAEGFGAGVMTFAFHLKPGESASTGLVFDRIAGGAPVPKPLGLEGIEASREATAARWRDLLNHTRISAPYAAHKVVMPLRASLAYMLMTREGPALRPGARSYARAWIRDGSMMAQSLSALGQRDVAEAFARYFAAFQFESGKIPCCADKAGADPVPENDSHGEFITLVAETARMGAGRDFAQSLWPAVERAAEAIEALRKSESGPANRTPERSRFFGLLPPSISHEGYSDKAAYSYWDDFWGVKGLYETAALADFLAHHDTGGTAADRTAFLAKAASWRARADAFAADLGASIAAAQKYYGISTVPGAADRGDFDATSTTIASLLSVDRTAIPSGALTATFERAWREFLKRRDGPQDWKDYTPYEFRQVSAFLRLGQPERARALIDFFAQAMRPDNWQAWAEVVGREARRPRFLGDLPHIWVASDYARAALDFFAYDDPGAGRLILGAGIAPAWLEGPGVNVAGLETAYGPLSYRLRRAGHAIELLLEAGAAPPGGFVVRPAFWSSARLGPPQIAKGAVRAPDATGRYVLPAGTQRVIFPILAEAAAGPGDFQPVPGRQIEASLVDKDGDHHRFLLYTPAGVRARGASKGGAAKFPLLLFLHGSGERGTDLTRVAVHGPPRLAREGRAFPFFVVSPQLDEGEAAWSPSRLSALLDAIEERLPIDRRRIYLSGLSLGGYGTYELAAFAPERFAAIAPVSGAGDPARACALASLPIRAAHGGRDDVVAAGRDIAMIEAVRACGQAMSDGDQSLTLYPDFGHDAWTKFYADPALYSWFLRFERAGRAPSRRPRRQPK